MTTCNLARGYRYAGVHSGLRPDPERLDLALVVSDRRQPRRASSRRTAWWPRRSASAGSDCLPQRARGVVICSGNANACTGQQGLDDARRMAALAAEAIGCRAEQMLVCSTGVIGRPSAHGEHRRRASRTPPALWQWE